VLAVAAACVLAGAKSFREIGDQAADLPQDVLARLGGKPHPLLLRDTGCAEDASTGYAGNGPQVMATLRNLAK